MWFERWGGAETAAAAGFTEVGEMRSADIHPPLFLSLLFTLTDDKTLPFLTVDRGRFSVRARFELEVRFPFLRRLERD